MVARIHSAKVRLCYVSTAISQLFFKLLIRSLSLIMICFSFILYSKRFLNSLLCRGSVILWVNPLILVSFLKVCSGVVGNLDKVLILSFVGWVIIEILLSHRKSLELFDGIVVMGDLWEGEWLLVGVNGVDVHWNFFSDLLQFCSRSKSIIKVLLVEGNRKLV